MNALHSLLVATTLISSVIIIFLVLFSQSSDGGIISNSTNRFAPGSMNSLRNKSLAILAGVFVISILTIGAISTRTKKAERIAQQATETSKLIGDE
jgi:preprotein translocase subunit SecG